MNRISNRKRSPNRLISVFLRLFFYLIYQPFASIYDWVASTVSLGKWNEWVLSVLPDLHGPRVLELGHGPGHLQKAMIDKGIWASGVDASPHMGRLAARRMKRLGLQFNLVCARAQNLPFASASFSQIVATFPTEFILDGQTLDEVWRLLTPGGELVVMPVAWITGDKPLERFARWLFRSTGQAPEWDQRALEPAIRAGYHVEVDRKKLESSELLIIHAWKVEG